MSSISLFCKKGRQTKRSFSLFSRGDHVGAHLICRAPGAAIKFKIQGRVNEPASRRNRYSNVRRSHINIYGKFAGTRQRRGGQGPRRTAPRSSESTLRVTSTICSACTSPHTFYVSIGSQNKNVQFLKIVVL